MPSQTIFAGESTDWTYTGDPSTGTWDYCYVYVPSISSASSAPNPSVGNRHSKGVNMIWTDGHIDWKTQAALMAGQNGDVDFYYKRVK